MLHAPMWTVLSTRDQWKPLKPLGSMGYVVSHSPNVRCMGTMGSHSIVVLGWLGSPGGGKGTCNISSTHEHLCLFTMALWPYRNYYLITFFSFTLIITCASLWYIHWLYATGGVNCVISYPTQGILILFCTFLLQYLKGNPPTLLKSIFRT